ncbi:THUMP-like domain-containing protein [Nesterenkonia sp. HG001]|uniref:THUMP-like domain-containing protein n=1 Tax=Nesterenkonia sp. HG001 TaxID=2983207 RepID=UPI002AC58CB9|nr:SAM-dependent methyltransferase [Nesterenkonia sp. HG001]MDZ5076593.1 SAM-dependent methyltransferase [Nesterenkonia sp. HG001]
MPETSALAPLLTPQGWELVNSLPPYDPDDAARLNQELRRAGHPPELVAAALTQSRLRRDAAQKFGDFAARMLFTPDGLQQATRLPVAAAHARRFRDAGLTHVADLGCGLGGDSLALASLGLQVIAVDADEDTAAAATMNLTPFPEAQVRHTTAEAFVAELGEPQGWGLWLDPARRDAARGHGADGGARRIWDPESFSPPLSFVTALAATGLPLGVKLGPGIPHDLIPADCEAEWISVDGQVVEVVLWFNALARPGVRRAATVMSPSSVEELTSGADFEQHRSPDGTLGPEGLAGLLCEPDGAVIRAGLVADLAERLGGRMLDEHIAYFVLPADSAPPATAAVRCHRVLETFPYSVKRLRSWVQEQGVTSVEIKKRGVDVVPETLRRQILPGKKGRKAGSMKADSPTTDGPQHRTLVITRLGDQRIVAVVEPL